MRSLGLVSVLVFLPISQSSRGTTFLDYSGLQRESPFLYFEKERGMKDGRVVLEKVKETLVLLLFKAFSLPKHEMLFSFFEANM
jgi:hypothetical protein